MRKNNLLKKTVACILAAGLAISGVPGSSFSQTEIVKAAESNYTLSVKTHSATVKKGDTLTLEAIVKDGEGNEVTDLEKEKQKVWWWAEGSNSASATFENYDNKNGTSRSVNVTFNEVGNYQIKVKLENANTLTIPITVEEVSDATTAYSVRILPSKSQIEVGQEVEYTAVVTDGNGSVVTDLKSSGLHLYWWEESAEKTDGGSADGYSLTAKYKWNTVGTYTPSITLQNSDWSQTYINNNTTLMSVEVVDTAISYGLTLSASKKTYIKAGDSVTVTANYFTSDESSLTLGGKYKLYWWVDASNPDELTLDPVDLGTSSSENATSDDLKNGLVKSVKVTIPNAGEYKIHAALNKDGKDVAKYTIKLSSEDLENIYVDKVAMDKDFIRGVDISSYRSVVNSGASFYDFNGNKVNDEGFFKLLADNGVNWVRIRVWNNPYDSNGNGFGGGNCDLKKAIDMGKLATDAGMKVLIDFHYSDTWADPKRQLAPQAWKNLSVDERIAKLEEYTKDSLDKLYAAGVDVEMIQIGNETTNKICDISATEGTDADYAKYQRMCEAYSACSKGARASAKSNNKKLKVAIHIESPQKEGMYAEYAKALNDFGVDYDVFASSYYPMWHGTLDNLNTVLSNIAETYDKEVLVAETSWSYTLDDGDGTGNEVSETKDKTDNYQYSAQGQANELADVVKTMTETTNGIGVFYWEPAWIPTNYIYDGDGNYIESAYEANKAAWEKYGCGWATKACASYDPENVGENGEWAGGISVDNHAWFDFEGYPLASLKTFKYLVDGNTTLARKVWKVSAEDVTVVKGETIPEPKVTVRYNYGKDETATNVTWNQDELNNAIQNGEGEYVIHGTTVVSGESYEVSYTLNIILHNYLTNASLEDDIDGNWTIVGDKEKARIKGEDPHAGSKAFKYDKDLTEAGIYQEITLDKGVYKFGGYMQGNAKADTESYQVYVKVGDKTYTADATPAGWANWQNPEVTGVRIVKDNTKVIVGCKMTTTSAAWGTWDDFYLNKTEDVEHQLTKVEAKAATCTEAGNIAYYKCSECGELYSDETATTAITEADTVVAATGHSWDSGVITKEATATENGIRTYTCTVCHATHTEEVVYVAPSQPATPEQPAAPSQPTTPSQSQTELKSQTISVAKTSITKKYGDKNFSLKASAKTALTYTSSNKNVVIVSKNGKVTIKGAGSAVITITAQANDTYKAATKKVRITVKKANQTIKTAVSAKSYKVKALKNKKKTFSIKASAKTGVTYKVTSGSKYISVSKNGLVTIKKGTKKGTYKILVTASDNKNYNKATKVITIKVK